MTATVSFGGLSLDVDPYHIVSIEGLAGSPDVRTGDRPRVARHGLVAGRDYLGGRTVTLTFTVSAAASGATAFASAVAAVSAAFAPGAESETPLTFQVPGVAGGNLARTYVRARKMALPLPSSYFSNMADVVVELAATDPLLYADTETSVGVSLAGASSGLTFPAVFPITFGTAGSPSSVSLTNAGNATTYPTFTIYGPVTTPTIRNETLDKQLTVDLDLASGDFLVIDTAARTVLLNGTASRYAYLTSAQWFGLAPGVNDIRFSALVLSGATANISFRSAWV